MRSMLVVLYIVSKAYAPLGNGIDEDAMRTTMTMLLEEFNFENTWGCDFQAYSMVRGRGYGRELQLSDGGTLCVGCPARAYPATFVHLC